VAAQFEALQVPVGDGTGTQVDDHVEHGSVGAADQLRLTAAAADVHAADDAAGRPGQAVLGEAGRVDARLPRDVRVERPGEKASLVDVRLRREQQCARDARNRGDLHLTTPYRRRLTTETIFWNGIPKRFWLIFGKFT